MIRFMLFIAMINLAFFASSNSEGGFYAYHIHRESQVTIHGSTNINSFFCLSESHMPRGFILADFLPAENVLQFTDAQLDLMVSSFDCKNRLMNKDFQNALGGKDNPYIHIRLIETHMHDEHKTSNADYLTAVIEILINGVSRTTEVDVELNQGDGYTFHVKGSKKLRMSDFNIDPPSPGFGLVRVSDVIDIHFNLIVETSMISQN